VETLLASAGYEARGCAGAEEALQLVNELRPCLILMDIELAGAGGVELTRRLKADPVTRGIRCVAMTGFDRGDGGALARHAGCDDCISKPFRSQALLALVADELRSHPAPGSTSA
jgi:two-component system cell cycle response regulator